MSEGLDEYFRVGTSMHDVIFSTADNYGLEQYDPPPPRVTLVYDPSKKQFFVGYSHLPLFSSKPEKQDWVDAGDVVPVLKTYLAELWRETHAHQPLPKALECITER